MTYDGNGGALELLGHHEFSDQMMEMERAMLINVWGESGNSKCPHPLMASSPHRHAIYGPSPLDGGAALAFPRLDSAVRMALAMRGHDESEEKVLWECARREMFFIVDALDSATCVLDNHLVYTYPEEEGH